MKRIITLLALSLVGFITVAPAFAQGKTTPDTIKQKTRKKPQPKKKITDTAKKVY